MGRINDACFVSHFQYRFDIDNEKIMDSGLLDIYTIDTKKEDILSYMESSIYEANDEYIKEYWVVFLVSSKVDENTMNIQVYKYKERYTNYEMYPNNDNPIWWGVMKIETYQ